MSAGVYWLGVDPGLHGGLALLRPDGRHFMSQRTPILAGSGAARDEHHVGELANLLCSWLKLVADEDGEVRVALEEVGARPGQGVTSMFSFGVGFGLWRALCAVTMTPVHRIRPQDWQKITLRGRSRKDVKQMCVLVASELWPTVKLRGKADSGIADALLIAEAARQLLNARDKRGAPPLQPA